MFIDRKLRAVVCLFICCTLFVFACLLVCEFVDCLFGKFYLLMLLKIS